MFPELAFYSMCLKDNLQKEHGDLSATGVTRFKKKIQAQA